MAKQKFYVVWEGVTPGVYTSCTDCQLHVLMVGDSLASDIQGGSNAGLDTCWYNPNHAENPGKVIPTYEIASLEELYPLVMEQEELANVGLKNRRHQC